MGLLVVAVGLLLLSLAAGNALAVAELGGHGDDGLSGGGAVEELYGGGRDDFLDARDEGRDYVGRDLATSV